MLLTKYAVFVIIETIGCAPKKILLILGANAFDIRYFASFFMRAI